MLQFVGDKLELCCEFLLCCGSLVYFTHSFLEEAVHDHFLADKQVRTTRHLELAEWFKENSVGKRRAEVLNVQYTQAQDWSALHAVYLDNELGPETLEYLSDQALFGGWLKISSTLDLKIEDEYERVWADGGEVWQEQKVERFILSLLSYAGRATEFQTKLINGLLVTVQVITLDRGQTIVAS